MVVKRQTRSDLAAVAFAMGFPTVATWGYFVMFPDRGFMPILYGASKVVQFAFPVIWLFGIRRRGGFRKYPRTAGVVSGLLSGIGMSAVMWAVYGGFFRNGHMPDGAAARMASRVESFGALTPGAYLVMAVAFSVGHAFLEEYYWRWFVFGELRPRMGTPAASVLSSVAFMSHHVIVIGVFLGPGSFGTTVPLVSLAVAGAGAFWAWLYHRAGGLTGPWLSHVVADLAIFAIGYDLIRTLP